MPRSSLTSGKESILVVDDDPRLLLYTQTLLEAAHYQVETTTDSSEALQRVQHGKLPGLILLDMSSSDCDALQTIESIKRINPQQKIIVISCVNDTNLVVQAIRLGAVDCILKPFYQADLQKVVDRHVEVRADAIETTEAPEEIESRCFFLAASPVMRKVREQAASVAKVDIPVLLLGESGVGKEVLARLIHKLSHRSQSELVKVNCAALPADLLESELFGYEPGAFTGATRSKPGLFERCDNGTVLLDEIGEMDPLLQAKLLHVLQDGSFSRLGGRTTINADFRVLAATNINMKEAIHARDFREDLYYRLNAFTIKVPPLRERKEEIGPLIKHFMVEFCAKLGRRPTKVSEHLLQACLRYHWPGNLRELGNFVKRFVVLQDEDLAISELEQAPIERPISPDQSAVRTKMNGEGLKSLVRNLRLSAEPKVIEDVLVATHWNCKQAAIELKISYKALLYKMKQYHIAPPPLVRSPMSGLRSLGDRNVQ